MFVFHERTDLKNVEDIRQWVTLQTEVKDPRMTGSRGDALPCSHSPKTALRLWAWTGHFHKLLGVSTRLSSSFCVVCIPKGSESRNVIQTKCKGWCNNTYFTVACSEKKDSPSPKMRTTPQQECSGGKHSLQPTNFCEPAQSKPQIAAN